MQLQFLTIPFHTITVADHVLWSLDGQLYIVIIDRVINVYNITTASIVCTLECKNRIIAATFVTVSNYSSNPIFLTLRYGTVNLFG